MIMSRIRNSMALSLLLLGSNAAIISASAQNIVISSSVTNDYLTGTNGTVSQYTDAIPTPILQNTYTNVGSIVNNGTLSQGIALNNTPISLITNNSNLYGSTGLILGDGSGTAGTASTVTTFNNYGNTGGTAGTDFGIDLTASASSISVLNNLSSGVIQGGSGVRNNGTIGTINNSGLIKSYAAGNGAIDNFGTIGTINNSGTINSTAAASGGGIYNASSGVIGNIINTAGGLINTSNSSDVNRAAILNAGAITTITNYGSINGYTNTRPSINNTGTITTLNNGQGDNFTANNWLAYKGALPTNYNIIISSPTSYGQLYATGGITGVTSFGIYAGSAISTAAPYRGVFINTGSANISASTRSGTYDGYTWSLYQETAGGSLWDLKFSGVSATYTNASLVQTASALQGTYALQNAVLINGFTYDCPLFDVHGVCVSAGGRNTTVNAEGINNTSALLIGSYRLDANDSRIGAYVDQNLSVTGPGTVKLSNSTPMIGVFGVWAEKADGSGWEGRVAAGYGQKGATITRPIVVTSEAGSGTSYLTSQGAQAIGRYGFAFNGSAIVSPYAGVRYTQNNMGGYTEASSPSVTVPLTYSALNTNATTFLAGLGATYKGIPQTILFASAGVETDTNTNNGTYTATGVTGLRSINFNINPVTTRPTASLGAYYDVAKNQRLGVTGIYRQEAYQAVSTTTVMATYTVGL